STSLTPRKICRSANGEGLDSSLIVQAQPTPRRGACPGPVSGVSPPYRDPAMYHTIEFDEALTLDLELTRKHPLERVSILKGTRLRAQLRPHVLESDEG